MSMTGTRREAPETEIRIAGLRFAVFTTRNLVFLLAVLAMNYTLLRPSPVDLLYVLSFLITLFLMTLLEKQEVTRRSVTFILIVAAWGLSCLLASLPNFSEDGVAFELLSKTFAITIGIISVFVSMSWKKRHFEIFMKVYIVSCVIASILGTIGFLLQTELLTWDGRAKGFIDDPNMYGSFLLPAVVFCVYFLFRPRGNKVLLIGAMAIVLLGILLSFSRIAVVAVMICLFAYIFFHNRRRPRRLVLTIGSLVVIGVVLFAFASLTSAEFTEKLLDRLTFAKSYDLGEEGRYHRYLLVLPMIMENPIGLGVLQLDKIFPEPIHNIWLSSFVNYGWTGGIAWLVLAFGTVGVSIRNYRRTRNEITIVLLISLIGIVMCASLHEGEHWRQMWLHFGLIWGMNTFNFDLGAGPKARQIPPAKRSLPRRAGASRPPISTAASTSTGHVQRPMASPR
ncbi:O-antigen ligase family protein [Devosia sp. YIM 151766]|uniref:O-antigen ligase family protein n=1 Tax=Devosia sp. YIM 151766 TaxID=3017325 RepID=UPI00255D0C34|nr:O-antigen ligase family protein [Devosia sp. YIM 151766]WIY54030.1 O-antigen ligase family protein [Devosia sp. YIM 151766]